MHKVIEIYELMLSYYCREMFFRSIVGLLANTPIKVNVSSYKVRPFTNKDLITMSF